MAMARDSQATSQNETEDTDEENDSIENETEDITKENDSRENEPAEQIVEEPPKVKVVGPPVAKKPPRSLLERLGLATPKKPSPVFTVNFHDNAEPEVYTQNPRESGGSTSSPSRLSQILKYLDPRTYRKEKSPTEEHITQQNQQALEITPALRPLRNSMRDSGMIPIAMDKAENEKETSVRFQEEQMAEPRQEVVTKKPVAKQNIYVDNPTNIPSYMSGPGLYDTTTGKNLGLQYFPKPPSILAPKHQNQYVLIREEEEQLMKKPANLKQLRMIALVISVISMFFCFFILAVPALVLACHSTKHPKASVSLYRTSIILASAAIAISIILIAIWIVAVT